MPFLHLAWYRFLFDGKQIQKDQTPTELEMTDGDVIDAFKSQVGGGLYVIETRLH